MSYEQAIYNKARESAERAYEVIPNVNASYARKLPADPEVAITYITEQILPLVRQEYPEDKFTEGMASELESSKADDWMKMWWLEDAKYSPRVQAEQKTFEKFQDLVKDGKWYNMPKKKLDWEMKELGYDPNDKDSRKQFLDVLSQHDINYNRGKIVQNTMSGGDQTSIFPDKLPKSPAFLQHLAFAAYPAMTKEATRQSLTGDFNEGNMRRAGIADVLAGGTMAVAPSFRALSSPITQGLTAAGAETVRQAVQPTDASVADVLLAGTTAGTVPGIGQYLQGLVSKGASTGARQVARSFNRGLRGADDPLMTEKNALKALLKDARKQSEKARDVAMTTDGNPMGSVASIADLDNAARWGEAERKLNALGIETEGAGHDLYRAVEEARREVSEAKNALRESILAKPASRRKADIVDHKADINLKDTMLGEAQKKLDNAQAAWDQYNNERTVTGYMDEPFVEDVIGMSPDRIVGGPAIAYIPAQKNGVEQALKIYERPMTFAGANENAGSITGKSVNAYQGMRDRYRTEFPEMYQEQLISSGTSKWPKRAQVLGRILGGVGGRIEPTTGSLSTVLTGGNIGDKVTKFQETEWFNNLPKEKKNAIEKVLKGE